MKEHFINEISQLKRRLARQTAAAEDALRRALRAAGTPDAELALEVERGDAAIDREEIRIEEECLKILALYQPVASDLRTVITVLKINGEIERVADMAVGIARRARAVAEADVPAERRCDFSALATVATRMLKDALDAFAYRDPAAAENVIARDDEADALHGRDIGFIRKNVAEHPRFAAYYLDCMTISKNLERVGDLAADICEDVIYLERGKIVRHGNAAAETESE